MPRERVAYVLICPGCTGMGTVIWDETKEPSERKQDRKLVSVTIGFHAETDRLGLPGTWLICDSCDTSTPRKKTKFPRRSKNRDRKVIPNVCFALSVARSDWGAC